MTNHNTPSDQTSLETFVPHRCPVCTTLMDAYWQPGFGSMRGSWNEHCINPACDLYRVTLEAGAHAELTADQIEQYAAARARLVLEHMQLFGQAS